MQVTLKSRVITTRAELIAQVPEKSRGKPEKICTAKSVIQGYDLMNMAIY